MIMPLIPPRLALVILACTGLVACMKPNPLLDTLGEADESGTESTGSGGESETGDTEAGDTEASDTEAGDTEQDPPMPMPDLGAASCDPIEAFGPECGICLADSCCDLSTQCAEDSDCLCVATCMAEGGSTGTCGQQCGIKPKDVPLYQSIQACAGSACGAVCDGL